MPHRHPVPVFVAILVTLMAFAALASDPWLRGFGAGLMLCPAVELVAMWADWPRDREAADQ